VPSRNNITYLLILKNLYLHDLEKIPRGEGAVTFFCFMATPLGVVIGFLVVASLHSEAALVNWGLNVVCRREASKSQPQGKSAPSPVVEIAGCVLFWTASS